MKPMHGIALLLAFACAAIAVLAWRGAPRGTTPVGARTADATAPEGGNAGAATPAHPDDAAPSAAGAQAQSVAGSGPAGHGDAVAGAGATQGSGKVVAAQLRWPVTRRQRGGPAGAAAANSAAARVAVPVAFRALWYLGVDPEAEKTWSRAINDPALPPGVRSDLIVDMIDEGYTDNSHPTKADLPVILARLEIVERHAPHALDDVNRKAFADAYQHLLDLYLRLGGEPRRRG